ncbi:hypothetical protein CFP56_032003 [Quercus suber]|uniref:Uncharacterized protein n=1 Tax=Quercus suber TaxID=58331 RepID=A0AAW0JKX4_QUESU
MTLTVEEEEVITVPNEGRKDEIESCSLSLIGKFLTCKPFNKRAALNTLRKACLFQLKFQTEFELDRGPPFDMFSPKVKWKWVAGWRWWRR